MRDKEAVLSWLTEPRGDIAGRAQWMHMMLNAYTGFPTPQLVHGARAFLTPPVFDVMAEAAHWALLRDWPLRADSRWTIDPAQLAAEAALDVLLEAALRDELSEPARYALLVAAARGGGTGLWLPSPVWVDQGETWVDRLPSVDRALLRGTGLGVAELIDKGLVWRASWRYQTAYQAKDESLRLAPVEQHLVVVPRHLCLGSNWSSHVAADAMIRRLCTLAGNQQEGGTKVRPAAAASTSGAPDAGAVGGDAAGGTAWLAEESDRAPSEVLSALAEELFWAQSRPPRHELRAVLRRIVWAWQLLRGQVRLPAPCPVHGLALIAQDYQSWGCPRSYESVGTYPDSVDVGCGHETYSAPDADPDFWDEDLPPEQRLGFLADDQWCPTEGSDPGAPPDLPSPRWLQPTPSDTSTPF